MNEHSKSFSIIWKDYTRNLIIKVYYLQSVLLVILLLICIRNYIIVQDLENLFISAFSQNISLNIVF
jgi:hypothetical protein